MEKTVSVIIPTMKGREEMLKRLIASLPGSVEVIVVSDEDLLLAAKRNKGAKLAKGEYLLFIDDDNYVKEFSISEMLKHFTEEIGVMGMTGCYDDKKMVIADGGSKRNMLTGFTSGQRTNCLTWAVDTKHGYEVDEVANAFMIRRDVFDAAGGFDEENFPIDLDEADICKRIKGMGYRIVMNPQAIVYHKSQTYSAMPDFRRASNAYFLPRNKIFYSRKHLNALSFGVFITLFLPLHICVYTASLIWRKKFQLIPHYMEGTWHGIIGRRKNRHQPEL